MKYLLLKSQNQNSPQDSQIRSNSPFFIHNSFKFYAIVYNSNLQTITPRPLRTEKQHPELTLRKLRMLFFLIHDLFYLFETTHPKDLAPQENLLRLFQAAAEVHPHGS